MRWLLIGAMLVGCEEQRNPNICCETEAECAAIGFDSPQPCDLGVCVSRTCVESGCDGNEDCGEGSCLDGTCFTDSEFCAMSGGRVVFDSDRNGGRDLFVTLGDGTATALTTSADLETLPTPSPLRDKIAFLRTGSAAVDIFVEAADGTGAFNASNSNESDVDAVWSPSGQWLATTRDDGTISVVSSSGGGGGALPRGLAGAASVDPSWSPDSMYLTFASNLATEGGLYTISLDGSSKSEVKRIENARFSKPRWSLDGSKIVYLLNVGSQLADIYVTNREGTSNLPPLTSSVSASETDLALSHDGSMIAFVREQGDRRDIWTMHSDGSNPVSLTFDAGRNEHPRWSPDDRFLTFDTDRDGQWEVYRVSRDGTGAANVTLSAADDRNGDWLSCPPP